MSDLLSTNSGAIAEGNARMRQTADYNKSVSDHNNNLATQIQGLEATQSTASTLQQTKDATGGIWSAGNIPNKISAYKNFRDGTTTGSNPTSATESSLTDTGDGVFESEGIDTAPAGGEAKGLLSGVVGDDALATLGKGVGIIGSSAIGGYDLYKDFSGGHGFHLAGDNWASETSNALQIGGAIADIGGLIPGIGAPLALFGGILDLAGAGIGEVGELIDKEKQTTADKTLQTQGTETQVAQAPAEIQTTGRTY